MSLLRRMYRGETTFDFVGSRRRFWTISGVAILISLIALLTLRLNLGVDFEGGTLIDLENPAAVSVAAVRNVLSEVGQDGAKVQSTGGGSGMRVQTEQLDPETEDRVVDVLAALTGSDPSQASRVSVGPTFGSQVAESALRALIIFLIVVGIFISWRLEWKMALAALVALVHDLLLTGGVYALVGFEVSPATVIAILTILGYSLYDTVVVFDKVIENVEERGDRHTYSALVNMSMNQVLMRSINTSLTSLLPIGSLLFVGSYLLGAATLREFALALFIGVAAGTYSSIFVASPLLAVWKEREDHWQRARTRQSRRGIEDEFATALVPAAAVAVDESYPDTGGLVASGAVPRPPKKRRRRR